MYDFKGLPTLKIIPIDADVIAGMSANKIVFEAVPEKGVFANKLFAINYAVVVTEIVVYIDWPELFTAFALM
jgi:hypothetical protein